MTTNTTDSSTDQTTGDSHPTERSASSWRTVDIVVASAVAAAFGVVFWAWGNLWNALDATFAAYPPGRAFLYGMWLVPGVLGALLIRKRGAAIYTELVASLVSVLLGVAWGLNVVAYGLIEGAAAELVFAFVLYKSWRLPVALAAGASAGAAAALLDLAFYYPDWSGSWMLAYVAMIVASSTLLAGLGSWLSSGRWPAPASCRRSPPVATRSASDASHAAFQASCGRRHTTRTACLVSKRPHEVGVSGQQADAAAGPAGGGRRPRLGVAALRSPGLGPSRRRPARRAGRAGAAARPVRRREEHAALGARRPARPLRRRRAGGLGPASTAGRPGRSARGPGW